MIILKLFLKVLLLPVYLIVTFVAFMVNFASSMASVVVGLYFFFMILMIIWFGYNHNWFGVGLSIGVSFVGFLISFAAVAINEILMLLSEKIGEVLMS